VTKSLYPIVAPFTKDQDNEKLKHDRATKLAKCIHQFFYFTWATWYGYQVFKDAKWFPQELGGTGSWAQMSVSMEGNPFVKNHDGAIKYAML
jgi:hypothetical protein